MDISAKVHSYIESQDEKHHALLRRLRETIQEEVSEVTETISYEIPCFTYLYMLFGIGVAKKVTGLYTMNPALVADMMTGKVISKYKRNTSLMDVFSAETSGQERLVRAPRWPLRPYGGTQSGTCQVQAG